MISVEHLLQACNLLVLRAGARGSELQFIKRAEENGVEAYHYRSPKLENAIERLVQERTGGRASDEARETEDLPRIVGSSPSRTCQLSELPQLSAYRTIRK